MSLVPFDPNGMVMDLLRSCYRQKISYIAGDASIQETATWYRAAPTALPFPFPHAFGSPTWDTVHPTLTTIGFDATKPRSWSNGRRFNSSLGRSFAGIAEWFITGAPSPANLERGRNGTPVECLTPPFGIALGGESVSSLPIEGALILGGESVALVPGVACADCAGAFTPSTVTVTLSGFAGAYADYNGAHQLVQQVGPCQWFLALAGTHSLLLNRIAGGIWQLSLTGSAIGCSYQAATADCLGPDILTQVFSVIGGDSTCTISYP